MHREPTETEELASILYEVIGFLATRADTPFGLDYAKELLERCHKIMLPDELSNEE